MLMKLLLVLGAALLMACAPPVKQDDSKYGASIGIVNHTARYIHSATVNGAGGANMDAWGAGINDVCCVSVPVKWYPGMQVLVRWNMPENGKYVFKEKMVTVEKYDEPGSVYMHFFPDDEVRVVVSRHWSISGKHPIPAPVKPMSLSNQSQTVAVGK